MQKFVDRESLKVAIIKSGYKKVYICKYLGINSSSFWQKLNRDRDFTEYEMVKLKQLFGSHIFLR